MARPTTMPAPVETPCSIRHRMSACTLVARAAPTEATVKTASDDHDHGLAPEAVGERAVEEEHEAEGEQVGRERLLHLDRRGVQRLLHAAEGGQVGVHGERAEGRERAQHRREGDAEGARLAVGGAHFARPAAHATRAAAGERALEVLAGRASSPASPPRGRRGTRRRAGCAAAPSTENGRAPSRVETMPSRAFRNPVHASSGRPSCGEAFPSGVNRQRPRRRPRPRSAASPLPKPSATGSAWQDLHERASRRMVCEKSLAYRRRKSDVRRLALPPGCGRRS